MAERPPQDHQELPAPAGSDRRRIVVVGPCASGKSTLVDGLRQIGYDARVSGQEHSAVAELWRRSRPDVLIALSVDIAAVRLRRGQQWPEWLHGLQLQRLRSAAAAADLTIDTSHLAPPALIAQVLVFLRGGDAG